LDEQPEWWKNNFSHKPFRLRQLQEWVYGRQVLDPDKMENLPLDLRKELKQISPPRLTIADKQLSKGKDVEKMIFRTIDGERLESVLLHSDKRRTVCISSQLGCAIGCAFCHTGSAGYRRNLDCAEIVEQVLRIAAGEASRISNIVVMGMGEPMCNYDNVLSALRQLNHPNGFALGARHITVSTVGIRGGIQRFSQEPEQWGLAVSLHAASDHLRRKLIPSPAALSIEELMHEVDIYIEHTNRRVTFEYVMLDKINSSVGEAWRLAKLLKDKLVHVNLIQYNQVPSLPYHPAREKSLREFRDVMQQNGISCTCREKKGEDILAACGQLAHRSNP